MTLEERFDEKVNELKNVPIEFFRSGEIGAESKIVEFGYRVQIGDEIFKVVDFGNIKKFLRSEIQRVLDEAEKMLPEARGAKNYDNSHEAIMHSDYDYGWNSYRLEIKSRFNKLKNI